MSSHTTEHTRAGVLWSSTSQTSADEFVISLVAADATTGLSVVEATLRGHPGHLADTVRTLEECFDVVLPDRARRRAPTSIAAARSRHPRAYLPWTAADDADLAASWLAGRSVRELACDLDRGEGAIRSRLVRLGHDPAVPRSAAG